jgi:hypothetical protein
MPCAAIFAYGRSSDEFILRRTSDLMITAQASMWLALRPREASQLLTDPYMNSRMLQACDIASLSTIFSRGR